ncbi:UDP-N-acetylglucosamine 2-epimerase [Sulfuriflexus sp.]|uniref:UDP-N-acetylglucosamine 2-epimerase n=1 Tax=Sulfuriflexus sp. TaxID=2015443 RepID=UPI0028CF1440|nr:UDP-N-acetylglucosamine 2-epimerase [Sulfuriflexus sp.]MDT8404339.1 UDP-N-acetylglucosamine 2-epimerase [Sulfuriflexus sp.]
MAPIMFSLEKRGIRYHLLDLSQHGGLTDNILQVFRLKPVVSKFSNIDRPLDSYKDIFVWLFSVGIHVITWWKIKKTLFLDKEGIALVHGDTLSTLVGLVLAKLAGMRLGLVEAGLRSGKLLEPFPEELIRRIVEKGADILFIPGSDIATKIMNYKDGKRIIDTHYNTGNDAVRLIRDLYTIKGESENSSYNVVTLHRYETISSKKHLEKAIKYIIELASSIGPCTFVLHPPTKKFLLKFGLMHLLEESEDIIITDLLPYHEFIKMLIGCKYIVTDGGSIQEEATFLQKPCIVLRNRTERIDGLGVNIALTTWDAKRDSVFLASRKHCAEDSKAENHNLATNIIIENILKYRE